jgi:hypothetical protein
LRSPRRSLWLFLKKHPEFSKSWFAFFQMSPARVPLEPVSSYSPLAMRARICLEWPLFQHPPSTACSAKRKLSRYSIGSTPICQSSGIASRSRCPSAPFRHMAPAGDMVFIFDLRFSSSSISRSSSHGLIQSSDSIPPGFASVSCVR